MSKVKCLLLRLTGAIILLMFPALIIAQTPTYQMKIANAAQVSCNVYEFDVTLNSTNPANLLKLVNFQIGILLDPVIIPVGGVVDIALVPGSSQIPVTAQQPGPEKFVYDQLNNVIRVAPVVPPGSANAATVPLAGFRLFRVRVACTMPFVTGTNPNHIWNFTFPPYYPTKVFGYIGTINTDVTNPTSHILVAPANPVFTGGFPDPAPQTVNGGGTICTLPGATGLQIGLASSQSGYSYYLYRNGVPVTNAFVFGTGSAVNFPLQSQPGTYTVFSTSCAGSIPMNGQAVIDTINPVIASVSISASPGNIVLPGTQVSYTATSVNAGALPFYQWYVNGVADLVNGFGVSTYIYTPLNGDQISCEMYPDASACTPTTIANSNVITMLVGTCANFIDVTNAEICTGGLYSWRGSFYNQTGVYYDSLMSILPPGCDSVYVLNLTVHPDYEFVTTAEICDGEIFTWRGNTFTSSGVFTDVFLSQFGCDSIYKLNLTVHPTYEFVTNAGICEGDIYPWRGNDYTLPGTYYDSLMTQNGCDSIFRLNLEVYPVYVDITDAEICEGDSYTWRDSVYAITGTYIVNLSTPQNCDSTFVLNLTVNTLPLVSISGLNALYCVYNPVATMIGTPAGGTFSGNGVTGNQFDPDAAGLGTWTIVYSYTDVNGCSNSTSINVTVDPCLSVETYDNGNLMIYPNPVNEKLTVEIYSVDVTDHIWNLYDVNGKIIMSGTQKLSAGVNFLYIETMHLSNGLYTLQSNQNGSMQNARVIKQ
jgi:hypothetical protein